VATGERVDRGPGAARGTATAAARCSRPRTARCPATDRIDRSTAPRKRHRTSSDSAGVARTVRMVAPSAVPVGSMAGTGLVIAAPSARSAVLPTAIVYPGRSASQPPRGRVPPSGIDGRRQRARCWRAANTPAEGCRPVSRGAAPDGIGGLTTVGVTALQRASLRGRSRSAFSQVGAALNATASVRLSSATTRAGPHRPGGGQRR
jgi:hypothetical protein